MHYRFLQFYPLPGAQCKFHIVYDPPDDLFWTTVTIPTNTWQDREPLRTLGFQGPPGNERRVLILMYSIDALNWFQAGCVAMDRNPGRFHAGLPSLVSSYSFHEIVALGLDRPESDFPSAK